MIVEGLALVENHAEIPRLVSIANIVKSAHGIDQNIRV